MFWKLGGNAIAWEGISGMVIWCGKCGGRFRDVDVWLAHGCQWGMHVADKPPEETQDHDDRKAEE